MLSLRPCPILLSSLLPRGSPRIPAGISARFQPIFGARLEARAVGTAPARVWRSGIVRHPQRASTRYFIPSRYASVLAAQPATEQPATEGTSPAASSTSAQTTTTNEPSSGTPPSTDVKKEEPKPEEPLIPIGSLLEFKRVDAVWESDDWVLKDSAEPKPTDDKYRGFSFTVVRTLDETTSRTKSLELELKNAQLKDACQHVIQQFDGISWNSHVLRIPIDVFVAFFDDLVVYHQQLTTLEESDRTEDNLAREQHLRLLLDFLRLERKAQLEELDALKLHGETTFELLWSIMRPRTILFIPRCSVSGESRAVRLISAEKRTPPQEPAYWRLLCEYVESTGNGAKVLAASEDRGPRFGFSEIKLKVPKFTGTQKITSLPAYPMTSHPRQDEMRRRFIARGHKWKDLDGVHNKYYDATAFRLNERDRKYYRLHVKSRIMVDMASFRSVNSNYPLPVTKGTSNEDEDDDYYYYENDNDGEAREVAQLSDTLTDDQLLLTPAIVYGFSLSDKYWLEFNVEAIKTFTWNDEAFERLVLPPAQKSLIKSLVESHQTEHVQFDDFIEGKGQGLVINLHGCPGVGKTLSAEATSEHVRRPLYVVGAGDLGTTAWELDKNLTEIFAVGASWNAIVLIDEADVFLEQRSMHELARNGMVAVFLRQLEYFRGILFLTTNRVQTFDEAFQSRIHVSLRYNALDTDTRLAIWSTFLERIKLPPADLSEEEWRILGVKALNGRQIKNAARTAMAVAASRGEPIAFDHITEVLEVMEQFEEDFRQPS